MESEYEVQCESSEVVVVVCSAVFDLNVEVVFAVEVEVLLESHIAGSEPVFHLFSSVGECIERGGIKGVSAEVCISFSLYIGSSETEGTWFLEVHMAIAEACRPHIRISVGIGVLVVVAEYVKASAEISGEACAPDIDLVIAGAFDIVHIIGEATSGAGELCISQFGVSVYHIVLVTSPVIETAIAYSQVQCIIGMISDFSALQFGIEEDTGLAEELVVFTQCNIYLIPKA